MPLRIGFIGVGGIAGNYLHSLKQLNRPVAAMCDVNQERADKAASEHSAKAYTDHAEMLAKEKLDVVFVCIPPGAQTSQVADAAKAGANLFVAKPIALDLETARRSRDAISKAGVIDQVGYMARYSDITEKAKQIVGNRPLSMGSGRFMVRMGAGHPWWGKKALSGGQMLEQSTHVFDFLRYFLGEVTEVQAFGHKGLGDDIADFEDSTVCNLHFASGAIGNVMSTSCANVVADAFSAELVGRDFHLKLAMDKTLTGRENEKPIEFNGEETGYFRQVDLFIQAVEKRDRNLVRSTYDDAARTLAVTLAANRSLETGKIEKVQAV